MSTMFHPFLFRTTCKASFRPNLILGRQGWLFRVPNEAKALASPGSLRNWDTSSDKNDTNHNGSDGYTYYVAMLKTPT